MERIIQYSTVQYRGVLSLCKEEVVGFLLGFIVNSVCGVKSRGGGLYMLVQHTERF